MKADRVAITIRIDRELDEAFKIIAEAQDKPLSRVYRAAFEDYANKFSGIISRAKLPQSGTRRHKTSPT
jgi:predicted transcriptional regulator